LADSFEDAGTPSLPAAPADEPVFFWPDAEAPVGLALLLLLLFPL
jgi:hypothetical protein